MSVEEGERSATDGGVKCGPHVDVVSAISDIATVCGSTQSVLAAYTPPTPF